MSTPGASSRLNAEPASGAEATGAANGQFPRLLAGIFAANGTADGAARPAKRTLAARLAGSPDPSETAPKPVAGAQDLEPDPAQLAAGQTIYAVQTQPTLAIALARQNLPAPAESTSLAGTDGKPVGTSSAQLPPPSQAPDGQDTDAPETTPAVELEVEVGLPGPGVTAPLEAFAAGQPAMPRQTAHGGQPPHALAIPLATGNPAAAEVDGAPGAKRVAPQPGAKLPIGAENPAAAGIEPAFPLPAAGTAGPRSAPIDATGTPADVPAPHELAGVSRKAVEPVPAQPGTPSLAHKPPGDPAGAIPADEMAALAGVPAPVEPAAAISGPTDSSGRRANRTPAATPPGRRPSGSVVAQVLALSGQVPRTVDSIPPAAPAPQPMPAFRTVESRALPVPAEAAPGSTAESLLAATDGVPSGPVRALNTSTPDRGEVAFTLRAQAVPTPEGNAPHDSPAGFPAAEGSQRTMPAQPGVVAAPDPAAASEKRELLPDGPDHTPAPAGRERRPLAAPAEHVGPPAGATAGKANPPASADAQVKTETAPERPAANESAAAKPVRPQDLMEGAAKPEAPKAPVVRDMKFEVAGGQQRVEVRLSERAGEVKMTVRTADEPLANTLRENLPTLSARLAESGFKSEAWRPAASSTNELRHTAESGARGASHDTNRDGDAQPRQQEREPPDGAGQRHPKSPQEVTPQKEKGKDFAWLMSSLR